MTEFNNPEVLEAAANLECSDRCVYILQDYGKLYQIRQQETEALHFKHQRSTQKCSSFIKKYWKLFKTKRKQGISSLDRADFYEQMHRYLQKRDISTKDSDFGEFCRSESVYKQAYVSVASNH